MNRPKPGVGDWAKNNFLRRWKGHWRSELLERALQPRSAMNSFAHCIWRISRWRKLVRLGRKLRGNRLWKPTGLICEAQRRRFCERAPLRQRHANWQIRCLRNCTGLGMEKRGSDHCFVISTDEAH